MNILEKAEFYPIEMIYAVGFFLQDDDFQLELLPNQNMTIEEMLTLDAKHPYIESFSTTFDKIYIIGAWLIDKSIEMPSRAEEILISYHSDKIRDAYLDWLKEAKE
jgi:hypothetical protein